MSNLYVVVDNLATWAPYFSTEQVITAQSYLSTPDYRRADGQIYNLCPDFSYRSEGYYCSLLAQARGQRIMPSVRTINEVASGALIKLNVDVLTKVQRYLDSAMLGGEGHFTVKIFFGKTRISELQKLARKLFEAFPAPILEVEFDRQLNWQISAVRLGKLQSLSDQEQDEFSEALDGFSKKIWRTPRSGKSSRFDLAILVDPEEPMPPSNKGALQKFMQQAKLLNMDVDLIVPQEINRLLEYDALFIRQTTAVNHATYAFAQLAARHNMPVIDDPDSIIKCTNKVFLHELLTSNRVAVPKSIMLFSGSPLSYEALVEQLGTPLVLKIPDGSFSVGIVKASNADEFKVATNELFAQSSVIIVQEYIPTEFDWRIGVLNGRALYACKYLMARGHWQIYNHQGDSVKSGGFETVAVHKVPRPVLKAALKAASLIGNSLYGVDLKATQNAVVVIEVNDNPNVDKGVEDAYLGDDLYRIILDEFVRRLEARGRAH